jgi:hypothetical protein
MFSIDVRLWDSLRDGGQVPCAENPMPFLVIARASILKSMTVVEARSFPSAFGHVAELPSLYRGFAKLVKKHL